jgi:hypothetical protein
VNKTTALGSSCSSLDDYMKECTVTEDIIDATFEEEED